MTRKVFIVLATYQGAEYVELLLESLRRQSHDDWTLLARDDGSSDGTAEILARLAARDGRIQLLAGGGPRRGAAGNFGVVLQRACDLGADYVFPADQDDVSREDKIRKQLQRMEQSEAATAGRSPRLVCSDLIVVDRELRLVDPSLLRYARLRRGGGRPLRTLLGRCFALGCASLANRPLLELALPLPAAIASHDWWLALCAAAAGRIDCLPEPTLWYRRHGENSSGPAGFWAGFNPRKHSWRQRWETGYRSFRQSLRRRRPCNGDWRIAALPRRRKRAAICDASAPSSSALSPRGCASRNSSPWESPPSTCRGGFSITFAWARCRAAATGSEYCDFAPCRGLCRRPLRCDARNSPATKKSRWPVNNPIRYEIVKSLAFARSYVVILNPRNSLA